MSMQNTTHLPCTIEKVLDSLPLRVFWKDLNLCYLGANKLFLDDGGVSHVDMLIGKSDYDMCWHAQAENFRNDDKRVIESGEAKLGIEEEQRQLDGSVRWLLTNKVPLKDNDGKVIGVMGTYHDITDKILYQEEIKSYAHIDSLTGLANRRELQNQIMKYYGANAGLIFIDLDYFKTVNDSLGHSVGDVLLQLVAKRLQGIINNEGTIARLGGDEFSVFVPLFDATHEDRNKVLEQLTQRIIAGLVTPFRCQGHLVNLGASAGITILGEGDSNANHSFREADIAMYSAKSEGRNTYRFYDEKMQEKVKREHLLQSELRQAIKNKELHLLCQPQTNEKGAIIGAEALLRWENKVLGIVSPYEFIPIAERTGLIHAVGQWVIDEAFSILESWNTITHENPDFIFAINVSSKQFRNTDFANNIKKKIDEYALNPKHIQLEITESFFIENDPHIVESILELKDIGFSFAIDDFGTGYSCLSYLANLPIDKLKIDRSFVNQLTTESKNKNLVGTIINMAKSLQMDVIAEGVETEKEKNMLIDLDCYQFQGYFFSRPIKAETISNNYPQKYPHA